MWDFLQTLNAARLPNVFSLRQPAPLAPSAFILNFTQAVSGNVLQLWKKNWAKGILGKKKNPKTQKTQQNPLIFCLYRLCFFQERSPAAPVWDPTSLSLAYCTVRAGGSAPCLPLPPSRLHQPTCHPARGSQPQKDRAFAAASATKLAPHLTSTGRCPGSSSGLMSRNAAGWGLRGARGQGAPCWDPRHELTHPQVSFPPNFSIPTIPTPKARSTPES